MGRVVVLGSLNMDFVVEVGRLPDPGETVIGETLRTFHGGKGANQAVAAARLGAEVAMIGRVGADDSGRALVQGLAAESVDHSGVRVDGSSTTGAALIVVDTDGQNMITVARGANGKVGKVDVEAALAGLRPTDTLVLQLEVPLEVVSSALLGAAETRCRTILNAAPAAAIEPRALRAVDTLIVNELEASVLLGRPVADPRAAVEASVELAKSGPAAVVITLGAAGAVIADRDGVRLEPAPVVRAVDTTAAGDAFVGAFAAALARGVDRRQAVVLANAGGAAATTKLGAQSSLPRPEDLRTLFGIDWNEVIASKRIT